MKEFWLVYSDNSNGPNGNSAEFTTYGEAFDYARLKVKQGTGDLYIMQPHARLSLPVDLEMVSEEKSYRTDDPGKCDCATADE